MNQTLLVGSSYGVQYFLTEGMNHSIVARGRVPRFSSVLFRRNILVQIIQILGRQQDYLEAGDAGAAENC